MILGIDATSTSNGGALVHLIQLLKNINNKYFEKVFVWTSLDEINENTLGDNIKIIKIKKKKSFFKIVLAKIHSNQRINKI